ncbi:cytochrome P460 family protein [Thermodesulfobacteriota bacterium]
MKKSIIVMSAIVLTMGMVIGSLALADMPGPDPAELWTYITKDSPYTKWGFWPDHQGMQPGRAPHGPLHKVYVNDRGLNSSMPPLQYGSILVKENYSKDKKLGAITVMYKVNEYNPKDGDWFWVKYSPDGKADKFGKPKGCIGCHGTRAKNDFVTVHEFN